MPIHQSSREPVAAPPAYLEKAASVPPGSRASDVALPVPAACAIAREIASAFFAVPVAEIALPNRAGAPVCEARHVAMYLAHVAFQVPLSAIGGDFGRDRTSVAHAVRRIENRRDEDGFDAAMERLEMLAQAIRAALGQPPHCGAD